MKRPQFQWNYRRRHAWAKWKSVVLAVSHALSSWSVGPGLEEVLDALRDPAVTQHSQMPEASSSRTSSGWLQPAEHRGVIPTCCHKCFLLRGNHSQMSQMHQNWQYKWHDRYQHVLSSPPSSIRCFSSSWHVRFSLSLFLFVPYVLHPPLLSSLHLILPLLLFMLYILPF